jgi:hypothetical protein
MSVTAFIGAGAVLNVGGPSTSTLTTAVKNRAQWTGDPRNPHATIPAIRQIADALDAYYAPEGANFEDIFHAIEGIGSVQIGLTARTAKEFKPAVGAFVGAGLTARYDSIVLLGAVNDIIDEVAQHIMRYVAGFQLAGAHQWFADFWREATARCHWDIGTLNYDNCVEQSLAAGTWEDGFVQVDPGIYRFDPTRILTGALTRILHLHGSVFFGYPHPDISNRFPFEDQHEDLYRFDSHDVARRMWFGRSTNQAQAGESAIAGPIITGQRKPDKLLGYPYSAYQAVLHSALLRNPRLLIAGYGFGDLHFNRLLNRLTRIHGDDRRVVLIAYVPPDMRGEDWAPDAAIRDWPGVEMFHALAHLSRETRPLEGEYVNPWVCRDRRCRVYLEGFQDAVQNHGTEIINFLTT